MTFTQARERAKAFAVFGAIAGMGGALGLLLGGVLTEYLQWRWCLFVNVPVAIGALIAGRRVLPDLPAQRGTRLDLPGAALATGGLVAIVYGLSSAASRGWASGVTVSVLAAGIALLSAFVVTQTRVSTPLLPLRILANRNRAGSCLGIGLSVDRHVRPVPAADLRFPGRARIFAGAGRAGLPAALGSGAGQLDS